MNDDIIIEQIEKKFDKDESAIKWTQFILIRKQNGRVEDPIPPVVLGWLEKAIGVLANQMINHEGYMVRILLSIGYLKYSNFFRI